MKTGILALACSASLASASFAQAPEFIIDRDWDGSGTVKTTLDASEYRIIFEHSTAGGSLEGITVKAGTNVVWMGSVVCMKGISECAPLPSFSVTRHLPVVIAAQGKFKIGAVNLKLTDLRDCRGDRRRECPAPRD